jgi:hypothetical protein
MCIVFLLDKAHRVNMWEVTSTATSRCPANRWLAGKGRTGAATGVIPWQRRPQAQYRPEQWRLYLDKVAQPSPHYWATAMVIEKDFDPSQWKKVHFSALNSLNSGVSSLFVLIIIFLFNQP